MRIYDCMCGAPGAPGAPAAGELRPSELHYQGGLRIGSPYIERPLNRITLVSRSSMLGVLYKASPLHKESAVDGYPSYSVSPIYTFPK